MEVQATLDLKSSHKPSGKIDAERALRFKPVNTSEPYLVRNDAGQGRHRDSLVGGLMTPYADTVRPALTVLGELTSAASGVCGAEAAQCSWNCRQRGSGCETTSSMP